MKPSVDGSSFTPVRHPEILPLQPASIPDALKSRPRWVLWRLDIRDGKTTKPPYQASGALASVDDPSTWTDFNTALAAYQAGGFSGLGIMLTKDDPLSGVDLDKCLDPETGELEPVAAQIVAALPTYCEVSPSGRGLRLFALGKLPQGGRRKGKVEIYESGRYLTVTGHRFNGHGSIEECTAELAAVHRLIFSPVDAKPAPARAAEPSNLDDAALIEKARKARNGAVFYRLWSGDTSAHGGDDSAADLALCNALAFWTGNDPARIDRLFHQSGLMRPKWDQAHYSDGRTYGQATIDKAIEGNRETYSGKAGSANTQRAAHFNAGAGPQPTAGADSGPQLPTGENPYRGTDDANADLFLRLHGSDVRFCPPWDKWLLWSGSHWRIDERMDIDRLAADVPRMLYRRAADAHDSGQRRSMADLARKLENTVKRSTMLQAARHRVVVHHSDLDKGHFLLNARNGTIDLRTGKLRPHDRADLLTHDTDIEYDLTALCPIWTQFLLDVFAGDVELIRFVQRAIGYSLTGDVREQVLLICHGMGSNGKSVFLNILRKLLGKLAWQAAPDLLMADRNRRHPTEQADLFGKRVVVCQETGEGRRFNEVLVKQLTGGDAITARRMHEDNWSFEPTHKLWLSTNHKPEIRGTDYAIWRRPRLLPFTVSFTDDGTPRKDPTMEERLTAELPGILLWAVQGGLDWLRDGLGTASAVSAATADYQSEMDVLAAWISECCVVGKRFEAKAADLYASYTGWCDASGETAEPQRRFVVRLKERGFSRIRRTVGIFWLGLGLKSPNECRMQGYVDEMSISGSPFEPREDSAFLATSSYILHGEDEQGGSVDENRLADDFLSHPSPAQPAFPPVDADPVASPRPVLSADADALHAVLKLYRGWAMPDELAKKSGLGGTTRVMVAAQELATAGLALVERGMIKPAGVEVRS